MNLARRKEIAGSTSGTSSSQLIAATIGIIQWRSLHGSLADAGSGTGDLVRALLKTDQFAEITAFDILERPADLASRVVWHTADLNLPIDAPSNSFDVVASLGLIEYLENPFAFGREVYRVLRPGGTAIITTPNNESWRSLAALIFRGSFAGFAWNSSQLNLTALIRRDFDRILREAGFADIYFSYNNWGLPPKLILSWQTLSWGLLKGMRYSDDLLVTCRKP
jgi:2-polyprenyl-3-methyl-5-hydroxy-6-metoxy-1,4-benzoquinol methylase